MTSISRIQCDDKCEMLNLPLWFHAGRARTPGRSNHTELINLLLIQGVSEFDWGAAGPAAAQSSQCSSCQANHTSSRSFRGMSIPSKKSSISALSISSGYLFVSRPGIYTFASGSVKTEMQKNLGVFCGFYSKGFPGSGGRARCENTWLLGSRPVGISFITGVWEFVRGVSEFGLLKLRTRRRAPGLLASYPQVINRFFILGSLGV